MADVLAHLDRFELMEYVTISNTDEGTVAKIINRNSTVRVETSPVQLEEPVYDGVLGNVKFLAKVCAIEDVKATIIPVEYDGKEIIGSIEFSTDATTIGYEATSPKAVNIRVPPVKISHWDVEAELQPELGKTFSRLTEIQKLSNPKFEDFALDVVDGDLFLIFGTGTRTIRHRLQEGVDGMLPSSAYFNANRVNTLFSIVVGNGGGILSITPKAMRAICLSGDIQYTYVLPTTVNPKC